MMMRDYAKTTELSPPKGDATYLGASQAFSQVSPFNKKRYWYSLPPSRSIVVLNDPSFCFVKAMPFSIVQLLKSPTKATVLTLTTASFGSVKVTFFTVFAAAAFLAGATCGATSAFGALASFSCTGQTNHLVIAPLLLIPFVENSFKHGVSEQLDQCWINLHLHAEHGMFTFNVSNSCSKEKKSAITGGIGLNNIKKRLDLIYTGRYELNISEQEEMYVVKLTMQLSPLTQPATSNNILYSQLLPATTI